MPILTIEVFINPCPPLFEKQADLIIVQSRNGSGKIGDKKRERKTEGNFARSGSSGHGLINAIIPLSPFPFLLDQLNFPRRVDIESKKNGIYGEGGKRAPFFLFLFFFLDPVIISSISSSLPISTSNNSLSRN